MHKSDNQPQQTHHLHNETLQSRPRHNSAHVTTTPLVTTPPRHNTKGDVTITSSSLLRPRHNHTTRDNPAPVTTRRLVTTPPVKTPPVKTQKETLQSRRRHNHTPRDNSAPSQQEMRHYNPVLVTNLPPSQLCPRHKTPPLVK